MYPKNRKIYPAPHIIKGVILICIALLSWYPMFSTKFLNDDIQIIGTAIPGHFQEIFAPFYSINVWGFYFRPLLQSLFNLILFISGLQPLLFHILTLALYTSAVALTYRAGRKIGLQDNAAFIGAVLFAVFPGHDINAGWISATSDLLACNFLLIALILMARYIKEEPLKIKSGIILVLVFLLALISKEVAYMGFLLPGIFLFDKDAQGKSVRKRAAGFAGLFIGVMAILMVYRFAVVKSNLLTSSHIAHVTIPQLLINFLLYIPATVLSPDNLEQLFFLLKRPLDAVILIIAMVVGIFLFIKAAKALSRNEKMIIGKSIVWFIACIIPVLPVFMRWYCFTASVGISWIAGLFFLKIFEVSTPVWKKVLRFSFVMMIVYLVLSNMLTSFKWVDAGNIYESCVRAIQKTRVAGNEIYAWGVPDKYQRIAVMKLGVQETFAYALGKKNVRVDSPLRAEFIGSRSLVSVIPTSNRSFRMALNEGRFLFYGSRSRSVFINESLSQNTPLYSIKISTTIENYHIYSVADVTVKDSTILQKSVFFRRDNIVTFNK